MVMLARCVRDEVMQNHRVTLAPPDEVGVLLGSQFLFQRRRGTAPFPVQRAR